MSDKLAGGILAGSTSVSVPFVLRKTTDNTEQTGKVAADMTLSYWRQGGTRTAITGSDLAAVNSAYSSGGVKEVDSTNVPGLYRLDLPDAAVATGADWVVVSVKVASCYLFHERFALTTNVVQSGDAFARLGAPAGASVSADVAAIKSDSGGIKTKTDSLTFTVTGVVDSNVVDWKGSAAPANTGDAYARLGAPAGASVSADVAAIKSDTGTVLIDVNTGAGAIYTRIGAPAGVSVSADVAAVKSELDAVKAKTDNLPATPAATGDAMTLTSAYDFAKGTVAMTESYAADGAAPTPEQMQFMIWSLLAERSVSGVTLTAKKLDGTTSAMTFTLDDATNPSSQTRAT